MHRVPGRDSNVYDPKLLFDPLTRTVRVVAFLKDHAALEVNDKVDVVAAVATADAATHVAAWSDHPVRDGEPLTHGSLGDAAHLQSGFEGSGISGLGLKLAKKLDGGVKALCRERGLRQESASCNNDYLQFGIYKKDDAQE